MERKGQFPLIAVILFVAIAGLVWASNSGRISFSSKNLVLDVVENPKNYVGVNLSLKDIYVCYRSKIVAYREDGTPVNLPYQYGFLLNAYYKYDFYGTIESNLPKSGLVSVDKDGNQIGITYWFKVDRAVQKSPIDVTVHPYFAICDAN